MAFNDRNRIVLGDAGIDRLAASTVAVYGLGGVGAACAMDLVRAGVGTILAFDFDEVQESNLNRLYFGYRSEIGRKKTDAFADYARRVNPDVTIETRPLFLTGESARGEIPGGTDFIVDAIDALNPKVNLLAALSLSEIPFAASLGTAGRMRPELLKLSSIWKTKGCPLARDVRNRLRRLGVALDFPCVWSDEPPVPPVDPTVPRNPDGLPGRVRKTQGSLPFVPQAAGHMLASLAVRTILGLTAWPR